MKTVYKPEDANDCMDIFCGECMYNEIGIECPDWGMNNE